MNEHELLSEQHRQVRLFADALRLAVQSRPGDVLPEPRLRRLLEFELTRFRELLMTHFDLEEKGGYLRGVVRRRPGLSHRVEALLLQHAALRGDAAALAVAVASGQPLPEIAPRVLSLLDALGAHDTAENELLQETLLRDLPEAD